MNSKYSVGHLLYDPQIYDGMNTNMDDLPFYRKWLPQSTEGSVLELCCGTGRLTLPLVENGHLLTGVDFTASMLEEARDKSKAKHLGIEFIEGDMRTLNIDQSYNSIFIPFNSIHHLYGNKDLFDSLRTVKRHLKNDGTFLFDCFNPNIAFLAEGSKELKTISNYQTQDGREVIIKEIMSYESDTQINRIEWHYFINGNFHSIQNLDMRMFFPQELDNYLSISGFEIIKKFGSFEEAPFDQHSDKQIFVCKLK
ncbi:class I SAM-dependent methyltransferase [Winogradskyella aurantiaca]|uniref:class I SAM-dependent methyltransferase n=1 Tax=Winogradskyella aurantiaca TaxID=2219558 RepID=UPI000E1DF505|nr:class I SAM-dependent methyltransferase [Winogradskyella aurantiaca]